MAIARRLGPELEPLFLTLSAAAPVVERDGLRGRVRRLLRDPGLAATTTAGRGACGPACGRRSPRPTRTWSSSTAPTPTRRCSARCRAEATAVWCRRPLWKPGSSRVPLGRAGAFDAVLEPGELAESEDRGPTVALRDRAHRVDPIVLLDRSRAALARPRPRPSSGSSRGGRTCSSPSARGPRSARRPARALRHLAGREGVQVAALSSALALGRRRCPEGVVELRATYPMSRYFAAFDARDRRRRLQRLPRADRARRALAVRADAPPDRRPARPRPLGARRRASASASPAPTDPGLEAAARPPARRGRAPRAHRLRLARARPAQRRRRRGRLARGARAAASAAAERAAGRGRRRRAARFAPVSAALGAPSSPASPQTAVAAHPPAADQAAGADRDPRGRARRRRAHRPRSTAALAESGEQPAAHAGRHRLARARPRCASSGSASSTCPRAARARPSSPAAPTRTSCARRLELILRRAPEAPPRAGGAGWGSATLRSLRWRPPHP